MLRLIKISPILLLFYFNSGLANNEIISINHILQQKQAPVGIIFEVVSVEEGLLKTLLPDIKIAVTRLREKFPELPVAIVTHGKEQFALTSNNRSHELKAHKLVQEFVHDDIEVHVCSTHASWYAVTPEDFPDYVDVTAAGPAQINDYEEMGYELIVVTE